MLMPWLRTGDTAATHPRYLALFELADVDAMTRIATFGFVSLCATLSAAHLSDYLVSYGVAASVGHGAEAELLDIAVRSGLMEEVTVDGIRMWKIVDDTEFLHMRTKEEVEWERQRKTDNANPELIVPVRLRDGDACRYCGQVVNWRARKGRLRGTYDHRAAGKAATVDTMVVACQGCNAARGNDPLADERHPLLPAPTKPYYSPHTRDWITAHDWAKANGFTINTRAGRTLPPGTIPEDRQPLVDEQRPSSQLDNAPTAATRQPAGSRAPEPEPSQRPDTQPDTAPTHGSDPTTQADTAPTAATQHPAGPRAPHRQQRPANHADTAHPIPPRPRRQRDHAHQRNRPRPAPTPDLLDTADPAEPHSPASGSAGSGRDGTGLVGNRNHSHDAPSRSSRSRSRRGRRSRSQSTTSRSGDPHAQ
ncbi:hypothetical protein GCM10022140_58540 [Rhodococcus aetherivorans]